MKLVFTIFVATIFMFGDSYSYNINFGIKGSSDIIKKVKDPAPKFEKVSIDLAVDVEIKKSDRNFIVIETDDNIIDKINLFIRHNTLFISSNDSIAPTKLSILIGMVNLKEIRAYGASDIEIDGFNLNELVLDMSGASDIAFLNTTIKDLNIKADGTFKVKFDNSSVADSIYIKAGGAGDMLLAVDSKLKVDIAGAVTIKYRGNPKIEKSISGVANLVKIE
jgi:hypothetical protein